MNELRVAGIATRDAGNLVIETPVIVHDFTTKLRIPDKPHIASGPEVLKSRIRGKIEPFGR